MAGNCSVHKSLQHKSPDMSATGGCIGAYLVYLVMLLASFGIPDETRDERYDTDTGALESKAKHPPGQLVDSALVVELVERACKHTINACNMCNDSMLH